MRKKLTVKLDGESYDVEVVEVTPHQIGVMVNGRLHKVEVDDLPDMARQVDTHTPNITEMASAPVKAEPVGEVSGNPDEITAPMPGEIVEINVNPGDEVQPGKEVVVLEAMKMKNKIRVSRSGVVASIEVEKGDSVEYGQVLVRLQDEDV